MDQLIPTINSVFVKSVSEAKTKCTKSIIIPTVEIEPELIVGHCSTNGLQPTVTLEVIPCKIVALGTSGKTGKNAVIISEII